MTRVSVDVLIGAIAITIHFGAEVIRMQGDFARNHLNDFLAPLLLLPFAGIWSRPRERVSAFLHTFKGVFTLIIAATFIWEVVTPALVVGSTSDPVDALCYLAGALCFWTVHALNDQRQALSYRALERA